MFQFRYRILWLVAVALVLSAIGSAFTSTGLTDEVQWDNYSLALKGQRTFLLSGEFHTFRLPVPSLWLDILQKTKAMGLNAVSVYLHWGQIHPSPGVIDFDGIRAVQALFDAAKVAGIWIVLRPGPYMNGETTAGGIPHWVTSQVAGTLRTNATDYHAAWEDYVSGIINVTVPNQITEGGPVIAVQIDNEYSQSGFGRAEYFVELESAYRAGGIAVPLTYNDPGERMNFINGTGAVDIYGLDSYPQGFDCSNPGRWAPIPSNWHDYHEVVNPSQPFYFPEFQGGSFDAWGPTAPGYDACRELTGPDFQDVFYKAGLWAANAKLLNFYMLYGGTSWGGIAFPGVYTSYDYGSAIAENRVLTLKAAELRRQGLFIRSSPDFYKTDWIGNSSSSAVSISNTNAFAVFLSNPDTGAGFYITRQSDSTSTAITDFSLQVSTTNGTLTIPQVIPSIRLSGRQSKVIVTDYRFGDSHVLYSTASILFAGKIGIRDVLFLYGDSDQQHEFVVALKGKSSTTADSGIKATSDPSTNTTIFTVVGNITGLITIFDSDEQLILFGDTDTAGTFFAPVIPASGYSDEPEAFANYWQFGSNNTVLVGGPYLVRSASIAGSELQLRGDLNVSSDVTLTVIAPPEISSIVWNDRHVVDRSASVALSRVGGFVGQPASRLTADSFSVPQLSRWRFANSLPEIHANFSDEDWTIANHTTTNIPFKPFYGDGRVLYGCDYGFCENAVLWRGHFNASGSEESVNLTINGGEAFAASVWLNDAFLGTAFGNSTNNRHVLEEVDQVFTFPEGSVLVGQDNVITIVQDNMGHNETGSGIDAPKSPRGVRGFQLNTGNFSEWLVQGKIGGYTDFPDKTRGIMNDGGLFGERQGWHLPGFDTTGPEWTHRDLSEGLPGDTAGVGFFVTTFDLLFPVDSDVPLSFVFDDGVGKTGSPYRAFLFVNGWMMSKRVANLGPQAKFPVHEGILDHRGTNTVAIALWSMLPDSGVAPKLSLVADGLFEGGVGGIVVYNPTFEDVRGGGL